MKIKELKIFTQRLSEQTNFYNNILGLEINAQSTGKVSFNVGSSTLTLIEKKESTPYHFAFNIPANKELEALDWLKQRVEILKEGTNEILDFDTWNAKAIYFYDRDKNIVEFIARKNLNNSSVDPFDQNSLIEISEIGIPAPSIESVFEALNKDYGLKVYDGNFELFCAIGDETGLFICVDKNKKRWFPVGDEAFASDFEATIENNGQTYDLECINSKVNILSIY